MKQYQLAYVCSPLSAPEWPQILRNMTNAQNYMDLVKLELGCRAVALHAYLPFVLDEQNQEEREMAIKWGLEFLEHCDVLVVCGDRITNGMRGEVDHAFRHDLPVLVRRQRGQYTKVATSDSLERALGGEPLALPG